MLLFKRCFIYFCDFYKSEISVSNVKYLFLIIGQSLQVRPLQFPMQHVQQTVPVQVPVTASNGQTVYQTVHFPVQALSSVFNMPTTAQMIPQITQVKNLSINSNQNQTKKKLNSKNENSLF